MSKMYSCFAQLYAWRFHQVRIQPVIARLQGAVPSWGMTNLGVTFNRSAGGFDPLAVGHVTIIGPPLTTI